MIGRPGARLILQQALEDEVTELLGRGRYVRAEKTVSHRSGYEPKTIKMTSATERSPRLRSGLPRLRSPPRPMASRPHFVRALVRAGRNRPWLWRRDAGARSDRAGSRRGAGTPRNARRGREQRTQRPRARACVDPVVSRSSLVRASRDRISQGPPDRYRPVVIDPSLLGSRINSIVVILPSVTVYPTAPIGPEGVWITRPAAPLTSAGWHSVANRGPFCAQ